MFQREEVQIGQSNVRNWGNASFGGFSNQNSTNSETSSNNGFNTIMSDNADQMQSDRRLKVSQSALMQKHGKQVSFEEDSVGDRLSDTESSLTSASQLITGRNQHPSGNTGAGPLGRSTLISDHQTPGIHYHLPKHPEEIVDDVIPPILTAKPPKPPKSKITSFVVKAKSALNISKTGKEADATSQSSDSNTKFNDRRNKFGSSIMNGFNKLKKSNSSQGFITSSASVTITPGQKGRGTGTSVSRQIPSARTINSRDIHERDNDFDYPNPINATSRGPMQFNPLNGTVISGHLNSDTDLKTSNKVRESFDGSLYPTNLNHARDVPPMNASFAQNYNNSFDAGDGGMPIAGMPMSGSGKSGRRAMFSDEASYSYDNMQNIQLQGQSGGRNGAPKRGILKKNISATGLVNLEVLRTQIDHYDHS